MGKQTTTEGPPVATAEAVRINRETRELAVPLEIHEKLDLGQSIVAAFAELRAVEDELEQAKLHAKDESRRLEATIEGAVSTLRVGSVSRPVEVEIAMNFERGTVSLTRLDTGEVYSERPMSHQERQTAMHLA